MSSAVYVASDMLLCNKYFHRSFVAVTELLAVLAIKNQSDQPIYQYKERGLKNHACCQGCVGRIYGVEMSNLPVEYTA